MRSEIGRHPIYVMEVRDEGTSYHYLPPSSEVEPTPAARQAVMQASEAAGAPYECTKTWTTDAIYRETKGSQPCPEPGAATP